MILACDPGLHGAFAWRAGGDLHVRAMPTRTEIINRKPRLVLDDVEVFLFLESLKQHLETRTLVVEQVGGAPGQSAPAAFAFGRGVGMIETAARYEGYSVRRVAPQVWKGALHVPSDKHASRARASHLMPQGAHLWPLQKDEGKAEAAMILLWAQEHVR